MLAEAEVVAAVVVIGLDAIRDVMVDFCLLASKFDINIDVSKVMTIL